MMLLVNKEGSQFATVIVKKDNLFPFPVGTE
jgi:hypothetical protein